ncbi:hypothetical protein AMS68_005743 [Peltaster fructicola]|uniref:VLRF1 domain-containing protein n=1 Tax=Peltaster fructicola TaxID=286661 RepID=A0A6H0XZW6_9PEZI|nr:hypothetical protein AMS68_005743 [Peltaster fructicola]
MAAKCETPLDKMLQRPLYVFDLPSELLSSLEHKLDHAQPEEVSSATITPPSTPPRSDETRSQSPATTCNLCNLTFSSLQDQRTHARSDLHGYNLKQKLRGQKAVGEAEFERLVDELDESISGSDSEESTEDEIDDANVQGSKTKEDTLSSLLKRQARLKDGEADDAPTDVKRRKKGSGKAPIFWFKSPLLPSNTSLGIYRSVFSLHEQEEELHLVDSLRAKQIARAKPAAQSTKHDEDDDDGGVPLPGAVNQPAKSSGPHYFLCMIGGGHFAAMLVSLTPKIGKKAGVEERSATVLAHKTFHRYTTRRKQGGSQSANDSSKGNAHSAGAGIRRYNETALELDVRTLLADWKPWINSAELMFVRATGTTNRRTLFGPYDGQVLSQRDDRLRGFPFNTRRATQGELMRAFIELTRVKVSTIDEAALARKAAEEEAKAKQDAQRLNDKMEKVLKTIKLSKEDEEATLHTSQLQALIRRSKAPALVSYYQNNSLSVNFRFFPADKNHHAPSPLHLAAAQSAPACITALLVKVGVDPGVRNEEGRSAFELAGDRATRDAFSLARGQLGEDRWQWDKAGVPAALSQAEVDARATRERDEKMAEERAEKDRRQGEAQRLRQEDVQKQNAVKDKKYGLGKTLAAPMTAEQRRMEDAKGMTDEMRLRIERERRARAAEERMKRLQNGG